MSDLTPEQEVQLVQFKEITDYKDEDHDKVFRLLKVTNWNLEIAIARFFDNDFPTLLDHPIADDGGAFGFPTFDNGNNNNFESGSFPVNIPFPSPTRNGNGTANANEFPIPTPYALNGSAAGHLDYIDHPYLDLIPKLPKAGPIANKWKSSIGINGMNSKKQTKSGNVLSPIVFILMLFPRLLWVVGFGLEKILGPLFPNLFKFLGLRESLSSFPQSPIYFPNKKAAIHRGDREKVPSDHDNTEKKADVDDDIELANRTFKEYLEIVIGEPSDLIIFEGEFNQAFNLAKNELRWLMVVLVNSKSELSKKFVKQCLNNEAVLKFIKENNIILYCGDACYAEAFEVGKSYNCHSLPYVNLIANVSATGTTFPAMSIVTKCQGFENILTNHNGNAVEGCHTFIKKFTKRLQRIVDKYEPQLITQRYDKQETDFSRLLRQQQDEAYEQSLLKDKVRREERERVELEERSKLEVQQREERLKLLKLKQKELYLIDEIQRLFAQSNNGSKEEWIKGDYTTLQLRNHEGLRVIKKFTKLDSLYDVFVFVECKLKLIAEAKEREMGETELISEYLSINTDELAKEISLEFEEWEVDCYEHGFKFDLVSPMPRYKLQPLKDTLLKDVKEVWPNGSVLIESFETESDEEDSEQEEDEEEEEESDD